MLDGWSCTFSLSNVLAGFSRQPCTWANYILYCLVIVSNGPVGQSVAAVLGCYPRKWDCVVWLKENGTTIREFTICVLFYANTVVDFAYHKYYI